MGGLSSSSHYPYRKVFFIPLFSSLILFIFAVIPLFVRFDILRIRIEGSSRNISEIVKKDIFSKIQLEDIGISLNNKFGFTDMFKFFSFLYLACQKSIWTVSCYVDFHFPGLVVISFDSVKPLGFLVDGKNVFLISDRGEKLSEPISISKIYELRLNNLPFIKIESPQCSIQEVVDLIKILAEKINPDQIVCLDFSLEVYLKEGYKAIFPRDDFEKAVSRFVKFMNEILDSSVHEIDMRGGEKIFVK